MKKKNRFKRLLEVALIISLGTLLPYWVSVGLFNILPPNILFDARMMCHPVMAWGGGFVILMAAFFIGLIIYSIAHYIING